LITDFVYGIFVR